MIPEKPLGINRPEYSFVNPNTLLFLAGAPLSGKSTIAPLVASRIEACSIQNMDIFRLLAQEMEMIKPERKRNAFVSFGACDSYVFVGDGSYSPESLIIGFNSYARVVSSFLSKVVPRLEVQGAQRVLFEGVQLTPQVVSPFLTGNNKLIIVTLDIARLESNRDKRYGQDKELLQRYSSEKILLIQEELVRQGRELSPNKVFFVNNSADYIDSAAAVIRLLITEGVIS
ncbi:hypothetical protein HYS96_03690 [Candidatus Daviesbacteria bacterium]|nr:hypothetical protein [Candidatus Daviesbacteria bacterium]